MLVQKEKAESAIFVVPFFTLTVFAVYFLGTVINFFPFLVYNIPLYDLYHLLPDATLNFFPRFALSCAVNASPFRFSFFHFCRLAFPSFRPVFRPFSAAEKTPARPAVSRGFAP